MCQENINYDEYYEDEQMYTNQEEQQVIDELMRGIFLGEIKYDIHKKQLKNWFLFKLEIKELDNLVK